MAAAILSELKREQRSGITHYVSGQHRAYTMPPPDEDHALLVFVDAIGWAVLATCKLVDGEWQPDRDEGKVLRQAATGVGSGWRDFPADFKLSEPMRDALQNATPIGDTAGL
jgi:hypothetical protein